MIEDIISLGTIVVFLASFLLAIIAYNSVSRPKHSPPGPPLLPFIGNLHLILRSDTRNFYSELRKKYGDIFSLNVGFSHWIVINGYEMLKETFVRNGEFTSNRPDLIPWTFKGENIGIVIQSGQQWKENRKFALKQLRHVGVGSIDIEQRIQREIVFHISAIQSLNGQSFDIKHLLQRSILNVITSILFNERSNGEHSSLESLTHVFEDEVNSKVDLLLLSYPFLARIPWLRQIREKFSVERVVLKRIYEEHVASFEKGVIRDITDAYIQDQRGGGGGKDNTITELQFLGIARDLFEGATQTTTTALRWTLIHLIRQTEIQERIRAEIDEVVGKDRLPSLKDRSRMPFTEATIMEVLRLENIVPFSVVHTTTTDVYIKGHRIPKDAWLWLNLESVAKDDKIWDQPEEFQPFRFLDENGLLVKKKGFIPFSLGRRVCLGESFARSSIFLFLTAMVQRFVFLPETENEMPGLECALGEFLHRPKPFKLRAVSFDMP